MWIDRFLEFRSGQSARALKNLSLAEDYFGDHFPGYPVMPACLMLEGLAQTGGILVGEANDFRDNVVLAKVPHARFLRDVLAGEQLIYEVEISYLREEGSSVQGRICVGGEVAAEAEIFFAHVDPARAQQVFGRARFVFGGELQRMLDHVRDLKQRTKAEG